MLDGDVKGFHEVFLDHGLLASAWPQKRNWFKGADTVSLLAFLEDNLTKKIPGLRDATGKRLFKHCLETISGENLLLKVLYHCALWLTTDEPRILIKSGHQCMDSFLTCASFCYQEGLTRFKLQPKLHYVWRAGALNEHQERHHLPSLNPLAWATQHDGYFVRRICTSGPYQFEPFTPGASLDTTWHQLPFCRHHASDWPRSCTGSPCLSAGSLGMETSGLKTESQSQVDGWAGVGVIWKGWM